MKFKLIPEPKSMQIFEGDKGVQNCFLSREISEFVPISNTLFASAGESEITLIKNSDFEEEEYKLEIKNNKVNVTASAPNGAYYALCTLYQLLEINDGCAPACEIFDKPTRHQRGFSDDNSRGIISTLDDFKNIIRRMSMIKFNVYMPYIEDILKFDCIPESGKFSGAVEKDDFKELVEFAKQYYVKVIPIVNCMGHWDKNANLEAFRDLCLHNEDNPEKSATGDLDPRNPKVMEMLKNMLDEVIEVFGESAIIHLGGDEAISLVPIFGKEGAARHYNAYHKELYDYLAQKGIQMYMYSDMYMHIWGNYGFGVEYIDEMPSDITYVYWDYDAKTDYTKIEELRKRNKKFCISPATLSWSRLLPAYYNCWMNTRTLSLAGYDSDGLFMSAWCDSGTNIREENWFGLFVGAIFSWNIDTQMTYEQALESFFAHFYGIHNFDVNEFLKMTQYEGRWVDSMGLKEYNDNGKLDAYFYPNRGNATIKLQEEFFKDPAKEINLNLQKEMRKAIFDFERAEKYFATLAPKYNEIAYRSFLFDIKRSRVAARKLLALKHGPFRCREEAMATIPELEATLVEIKEILDEHKELWFACNRQSEWEFTEAKYLNLIDSMNIYIRYCRYNRRLGDEKYMVY